MVNVNVSYPDFSGGEISPKVYGRHDLALSYNTGRRVRNFITYPTGGANFRTGTIYANRTRGNVKALVYSFKYTSSFLLEFTPTAIRFYQNNGLVKDTAQNITGITQSNPAVVTYSGADTYSNGESVYLSDITGMTELNNKEFIVANVNVGSNTFELTGEDSSAYTAYVSGGTIEKIIEVTTPYMAGDLFSLKFAQDGKDLYIAHPDYNPQKLTFTSSTSWTLAAHSPTVESFGEIHTISGITQANPAVLTYVGANTYANGDTVIVTGVSGMTQVNDRRFLVSNVNVGAKTFELQDEDAVDVDSTGYTAYSSGGVLREIIFSAAEFLTAGKYPAAVGFYENRLYYGGSEDFPSTLYGSRGAEFDDFTLGNEVDDGILYVIAGGVGRIEWLRGTNKFLAIGTTGDVVQATGGLDDVITPTSISVKPSNSYGVADVNPDGKGNKIYYLQSNQLILRSFEYEFEQDNYIPVDRNTIADHITSTGVSQITFLEGRPNIVWASLLDGDLAGMTVEEGEGISGWHGHNTDGDFISVAELSRPNEYDQLWFCVEREGNYNVEYLADFPVYPRREDYYLTNNKDTDDEYFRNILFEAQKEYIHVDSCLSYYGDQIGIDATANLTLSGTSGTITITSDNPVFTNDMAVAARQIWRKSVTGAEFGRCQIIGFTSSTEVTCAVIEEFNGTSMPYGEWYLTSLAFGGLDHLEGKTVRVVNDGGHHPDRVVTNGFIFTERQSSVVHVGLSYSGYLETNELEGGGTNGVSQTKRKVVNAVGFRFLDTLYAKYGTSYYNLEQIEERTSVMKMDRPPELFTGDKYQKYTNDINDSNDGGRSRSKRVVVVQDQPFPCNVQLIVPYVSVTN